MIDAPAARRSAVAGTILLALLILNAYPLYQLSTTGGPLFFTNAFDEAVYLQYDYSRTVQQLSRAGQYPVTWAHQLGLSGGWINFILDLTMPLLFLLLLRGIALRLGMEPKRATLVAVAATVLPALAGGANPLVSRLFGWNLQGPLLGWLTIPEAHFLPLFRSPEPQFSFVLAAAAVLLALRLRSFWPAYAAAPFLYNFVVVPYVFVVLALHLRRVAWLRAWRAPALAMLSFLLVSGALALYMIVLVSDDMRRALVHTRAPLLSFTGVVALALYALVRPRIAPELRLPALLLAIAPFAAANQHIISGWMAQPNNYEQASGVLVIALVAALGFAAQPRVLLAFVALAFVLLLRFTAHSFADNDRWNAYLAPGSELLAALRSQPHNVVVNNLRIASIAGLLAPRQPVPLLAYENTFGPRASQTFQTYLCVRQRLRRTPAALAFEETFRTLDAGYRYRNTDFILLHIGRRPPGPPIHEPDTDPGSCPPLPLDVFVLPPHPGLPVGHFRDPPDSGFRDGGQLPARHPVRR